MDVAKFLSVIANQIVLEKNMPKEMKNGVKRKMENQQVTLK